MVGDVTMEEEVSGQLLAQTGSALRLKIERFRGSNDFHVDAVRLGPNHRILHGTVRARGPEIHVIDRPGAPRPPDGAAVGMMTVEHLRSAMNQPELCGVAHVGTWNCRRRIAERIGAITHRFVFEPEVLVLHVHVINAEWLAAIVDRAATGTIDIRERVALRQEVALLVQRTEGFIADLMIDQHKLTEVRAGAVLDDRLPAARGRRGIAGTQRLEVARSTRLDDECAKESHDRQLTVVAVGMELPDTLLGARMDVPFILAGLVFRDNRIRIGRRGSRPCRTDDHGGAVNMKADLFATVQLVAELDLEAVALVTTNHKRLNPLRLDTGNHGTRIVTFFVACFLIGVFLRTNLVDILIQDIHVARIKIEPLVERDLDIDRGDVVLLHRCCGGTLTATGHGDGLDTRVGDEQHILPAGTVLMHHGRGVVHTGVDALHLRILGHMLHDALMLLLDHCGTLAVAGHRILDDRLPFELLSPGGKLMIHGRMGRWVLGGCEGGPEKGRCCQHAERAGGSIDPCEMEKHGLASLRIYEWTDTMRV